MKTSNIVLAGIIIVFVGMGAYFLTKRPSENLTGPQPTAIVPTPSPTTEPQGEVPADGTKTVIGTSVEGRDITAYHYGSGSKELLFVGGIHGGYSWNTALLGYELMDYLAANPSIIPQNIRATVIPVLNPDGLNKVVGTAGRFAASDVSTSNETLKAGRFNANGVDLNRNFDCDWQAQGIWQHTTVSGGSKAFSEKESQAIKAYAEAHHPSAVVVWYSAAGGVFASSCSNGISSDTRTLMDTYAGASEYRAYDTFDFYEVTGDMANWLAGQNIPTVSVLLSTHQDTEWNKNKAGIEAVFAHYAQ